MRLDEVLVSSGPLIALFDEEPVLLLAAAIFQMRAHEGVRAAHLEAVHLDVKFAVANAFGGVAIGRIDNLIYAAIPQDYFAGAVVVPWDDAFEVAVIDRMIFDKDC